MRRDPFFCVCQSSIYSKAPAFILADLWVLIMYLKNKNEFYEKFWWWVFGRCFSPLTAKQRKWGCLAKVKGQSPSHSLILPGCRWGIWHITKLSCDPWPSMHSVFLWLFEMDKWICQKSKTLWFQSNMTSIWLATDYPWIKTCSRWCRVVNVFGCYIYHLWDGGTLLTDVS